MRAATRVNAEQASKRSMCRPTRLQFRGRLIRLGDLSEDDAQPLHRGTGGSTYTREVVDADLADYFGSIPHAELLKSVSRRIVDRRVLHLIRMWLDCPVEETTIAVGRRARPRLGTSGRFQFKSASNASIV